VRTPRKRGAPPGNRNRFKTGYYAKNNRAMRSNIAKIKCRVRDVIRLADAVLHAQAPSTPPSSPALCGRPNLSAVLVKDDYAT
jgi:hypothetical protein